VKKKFKKLMEEIKPFIKPKKYIRYSTAGKWVLTKFLCEKKGNNEQEKILRKRYFADGRKRVK